MPISLRPAALALIGACVLTAVPAAQRAPAASQAGVDVARLDAIPALVEQAIADKKLPGAVVLVGRGDRIVYEKAIGQRAVVPAPEAMTLDTIFDLASLTKVVATTTSVMKLVEDGRIRLNDRVSDYVPGFERYNKTNITIRHLMTHTSGLRPDVDLADAVDRLRHGDPARDRARVPTAPPGERFVYSDINYFLLGDIVRRVSGLPLDEFARKNIFEPLGMKDTMFLPPASLAARDRADGEVHALRLAVRGTRHEDAARRRPRPDGAPHGRRRRARRALQHGGRPGDLLPDAAQRRQLQGRAHPVAADRREDDDAGERRRAIRTSAASAGTSTRRSRRTAASCCRSARSATPGSPARRSGSIR